MRAEPLVRKPCIRYVSLYWPHKIANDTEIRVFMRDVYVEHIIRGQGLETLRSRTSMGHTLILLSGASALRSVAPVAP